MAMDQQTFFPRPAIALVAMTLTIAACAPPSDANLRTDLRTDALTLWTHVYFSDIVPDVCPEYTYTYEDFDEEDAEIIRLMRAKGYSASEARTAIDIVFDNELAILDAVDDLMAAEGISESRPAAFCAYAREQIQPGGILAPWLVPA